MSMAPYTNFGFSELKGTTPRPSPQCTCGGDHMTCTTWWPMHVCVHVTCLVCMCMCMCMLAKMLPPHVHVHVFLTCPPFCIACMFAFAVCLRVACSHACYMFTCMLHVHIIMLHNYTHACYMCMHVTCPHACYMYTCMLHVHVRACMGMHVCRSSMLFMNAVLSSHVNWVVIESEISSGLT